MKYQITCDAWRITKGTAPGVDFLPSTSGSVVCKGKRDVQAACRHGWPATQACSHREQ